MMWTTHTETLVCTSCYTYAYEMGPYVRFEVLPMVPQQMISAVRVPVEFVGYH